MLFIDLVSKYDEILPPAIAKKKRESERKVPVRRRTRPVDMRMSRSRISAGADLKELAAQQLAQRGIKVKSPPPTHAVIPPSPPTRNAPAPGSLPQVPESPRQIMDEPESMHPHEESASTQLTAEPEELPAIPPPPKPEPGDIVLEDKRSEPEIDYSKIPPPPPIPGKTAPSPPVPQPVSQPAHPVFKEPPPEMDDVPARPQFKEPPPEPESPPAPPRPARFVEPPVDDESAPTPPPTAVPPSIRRASTPRMHTPPSGGSRSPSPVKPGSPPASGAVTPNGGVNPSDGTARLRGPRLTRGPRPVSSLNRQSLVRPSSPGSPPAAASSGSATNGFPGSAGGGGGASLKRAGSRTMSKRSSISRVSELSRRTMASDAEDEVLQ